MVIRESLQYIQDAYAALTELSMLIVDDHGAPVTKVSNMTELAELVLFAAEKEAPSFFCPRELVIDGWQRPSVVPVGRFGMKSIVAPVFVDEKAEYWIWAGVFIGRAGAFGPSAPPFCAKRAASGRFFGGGGQAWLNEGKSRLYRMIDPLHKPLFLYV